MGKSVRYPEYLDAEKKKDAGKRHRNDFGCLGFFQARLRVTKRANSELKLSVSDVVERRQGCLQKVCQGERSKPDGGDDCGFHGACILNYWSRITLDLKIKKSHLGSQID